MKPLVSILIPANNVESWIADTIRSAIGQTWPRKEIVVVDDGSSDQTLAIARKFASTSVAIVSQPNQGASAARNHAFSLSQGDYIQWLDADDLLAPGKIATRSGPTPTIGIRGSKKVRRQRNCMKSYLACESVPPGCDR
jgi:glycosyltransferase involved in cell wall biosynthesis